MKRRNHLADLRKLLQEKTDELVMNQKRIDLRQQPPSLKELMLALALKYQGTLFCWDRRRFVRRSLKERYSRQYTKSSLKFGGGSVMVFGMISVAGTGPLVRLHGKINATVFKEISKKHVVSNMRTVINWPAVFMQDNAPCHIVKSVKTFLSEEDVTVIEWSAQNQTRILLRMFGSY